MAAYVATDQRWYFAEFDLSGDVTTNSPTFTQDAVEATTHGNTSRVYLPGLRTATVAHAGYSDLAASGVFDAINDTGTGPVVVTMTGDGDAAGAPALVMQMNRTSFTPWGGTVGAMAELAMAGQVSGTFAGGYMLAAKAGRTSSGTGTGVQVGALSGGTMVANLHVFSGTASTLAVTIQSDDNAGFTSASSRGSFTTASGATSEQITITSAGSDDYWRVSYTIGGGTWSFAVAVGII